MKKEKWIERENVYICKCGHRMLISHDMDKRLCKWCGVYVFKDEKEEFKYRFLEKQKSLQNGGLKWN